MDFVKMEGLGNDFLVVRGPLVPAAEEIAAWCDRHRGVGADGLLVVTAIDARQVRMEYWNADGSSAEMCGNGLRCVARYAVDQDLVAGDDFTVLTAMGERPVRILPQGMVRALIGDFSLGEVPAFDSFGFHFQPVSMGNPHAVAFVDDCRAVPVGEVGPAVENDPRFPDRTNVEFATVVSPQRIDVRVWERGVGETLASGSGASATAGLAFHRGLCEPRVTIALSGGPLQVELEGDRVWIEGPARTAFRGRV